VVCECNNCSSELSTSQSRSWPTFSAINSSRHFNTTNCNSYNRQPVPHSVHSAQQSAKCLVFSCAHLTLPYSSHTCCTRYWHMCYCKKVNQTCYTWHSWSSFTTPQPFYGPFSRPPGWAGARRGLLDIMVQGKISRGRHIDHPAGRHSIRTKQCPPPPLPHILQIGCPSCRPTNSVKALKTLKLLQRLSGIIKATAI